LNFPRNPCFGFALLPAMAAALPLHALFSLSLSLSRLISICCLLIAIHEFHIFAAELSDPFLYYKMQLEL
jgi:hypothetical protein